MTVNPKDLTHPKNHYCDHCKSPAGKWCVSSTGKIRNAYEKQHAVRIEKADRARGGPLIGGVFVESVYLAGGMRVPRACINALAELDEVWPGATLPQARAAISLRVLDAYYKLMNPKKPS